MAELVDFVQHRSGCGIGSSALACTCGLDRARKAAPAPDHAASMLRSLEGLRLREHREFSAWLERIAAGEPGALTQAAAWLVARADDAPRVTDGEPLDSFVVVRNVYRGAKPKTWGYTSCDPADFAGDRGKGLEFARAFVFPLEGGADDVE